jgi:hypothetical protein
MAPRIGFIISIFSFSFFISHSLQAQQKSCSKVDATVTVTDSRNGQPGSIKVSTGQPEAKFMLHLLGEGKSGQADQTKITTGTIENIRPGTYDLIIHYSDVRFCSETRTVTVN